MLFESYVLFLVHEKREKWQKVVFAVPYLKDSVVVVVVVVVVEVGHLVAIVAGKHRKGRR